MTESKDEMNIFLQHFGLSQYETALQDQGLDNLQIIHELQDDDINDLIQDVNLKQSDTTRFQNAIKAVKNGTYNSNKQQQEFKCEYKRIRYSQQLNINDEKENNKTIIFIGESGVGKTTLINSMCNYLYNVNYNDKFRYKLIDEIKQNNTQSQTQKVTKYCLNSKDLKVNYSLTIIDTPGFGNTESIENDINIKKQFKQCFEQIKSINAIYFVVKATETRLNDTQKYIFNIIFNLFYKNYGIKDNIFILFTFSDGSDPPAIQSINKTGIKYKSYFKINNSGFDAPPKQKNNTHQMFFNLGVAQFDIIFKQILHTKQKSTKQIVENLTNTINWQIHNKINKSPIISQHKHKDKHSIPPTKKSWFPDYMRKSYDKWIVGVQVQESEHDIKVKHAFHKLDSYKIQIESLLTATNQWNKLILQMNQSFPQVIAAFSINSETYTGNAYNDQLTESMKSISKELSSFKFTSTRQYSNIAKKLESSRNVNKDLETANHNKTIYEQQKYELDKCNATLKSLQINLKRLQNEILALDIQIKTTKSMIVAVDKEKHLLKQLHVNQSEDGKDALDSQLIKQKKELDGKTMELHRELDKQKNKIKEITQYEIQFQQSKKQLLTSVDVVEQNLTTYTQQFCDFVTKSGR